ncbi:unnamed protein product [Trifolium pratense]|uniref:Uncharacterized protein n=1 Tax=Trifolium pratense TaxID=57577 RepID=A0ACB0LNS0_TRIPR|nr:unnamed protein product [Trifolium pratense]
MDGSSENQSVKATKRQWTAEEDAVLVQGLLKLVDDGWKADAGSFKPGYTKVLEKYILNKFPGCTLKANPHIESRVKRLKSQYSAIKDMLGPSASGFGWDDTRKMIIVEKEIYSQWCKSHPTAIGLFGKPFPHFDSLDTVFGKDKASGNAAEDTVDMLICLFRWRRNSLHQLKGAGHELIWMAMKMIFCHRYQKHRQLTLLIIGLESVGEKGEA